MTASGRWSTQWRRPRRRNSGEVFLDRVGVADDAAVRVGLGAITLVLCAVALVSVLAQSTAPASPGAALPVPRLPDALPETLPDLTGVWSFATLTPLERPAELAGKATLTQEEAAALQKRTLDVQNRDRRDGEGADGRGSDGRTDLDRAYNQFWWDYGTTLVGTRRTSLVVDPPDGRIPPLTPEAARRQAERAAVRTRSPEGPEDRSLSERCLNVLTAGPPMLPGPYNNNVQLLQTAGHVAIFNEMIHDARLVPLDGRARLPSRVRQWLGDSRGRWDGDTLVVETTNFTAKTAFRGASERLHLVERFTRVSPETLLYEFTATDPSTWTRPWSVALPMTRTADKIYEYACHEGNVGLASILAGARAQERAERLRDRTR